VSPVIKGAWLSLFVVAGASLCAMPAAAASQAERPVLSPTERAAIMEAAQQAMKAIRAGDAKGLVPLVSRTQGLLCTDTTYPFSTVKRDLETTKSLLWQSLFDTKAFASRCGSEYPAQYPAISDAEFLKSSGDSIEVALDSPDWAHVTIRSSIRGHAQREWSLHKEAGEWKLAGRGFVIGNCSCG